MWHFNDWYALNEKIPFDVFGRISFLAFLIDLIVSKVCFTIYLNRNNPLLFTYFGEEIVVIAIVVLGISIFGWPHTYIHSRESYTEVNLIHNLISVTNEFISESSNNEIYFGIALPSSFHFQLFWWPFVAFIYFVWLNCEFTHTEQMKNLFGIFST